MPQMSVQGNRGAGERMLEVSWIDTFIATLFGTAGAALFRNASGRDFTVSYSGISYLLLEWPGSLVVIGKL